MSKSRKSLSPTGTGSRHSRSNSYPDNALADGLHPPRKTSQERRSFDAVSANFGPDPLQDGKLLVLKVIGKVNLRIERKEYQELIRIVNQIPGDVLVLISDNLSIESLYADIPSSLATLEALFSKIFYDRQGRLPDHGLSSDDFVHHLVRYFVDVLKYNNQTFASARSREHIKNIFNICTQMDDSLQQRLLQRAEQFSKALSGFSEHALLETITRSSATYYMKMHEALKTELERAVSHYKHALQKLSDALLSVPHKSAELSSVIAGHSQADMDDKTTQYMRKMSGQSIEQRLFFNQSLFNAVQINSRDKLLVTDLVDKLEARINHDKEVGGIPLFIRQTLRYSHGTEEERSMLDLLINMQIIPTVSTFHKILSVEEFCQISI